MSIPIDILGSSTAIVAALAATQTLISMKFRNQNQDSKDLAEKIAKITTEDIDKTDKDITKWDLIEDLVNKYHSQALTQAGIQFYFSVIAATTGFGLIIFMVITRGTSGELEMILKSLPGVAISSVAGLFFKQAGETRQRATELYDRLRNDKQIKEAISLVNTIDDINIKSVIKAQIALNMSGLKCDPVNTTELFNKILNNSD